METNKTPAGISGLTNNVRVCAVPVNARPEFLELPPQGRICSTSGLKRGMLYQLISDRKVESIVIRKRGKQRGKRLIVTDSLLSYLHGLKEAPGGE